MHFDLLNWFYETWDLLLFRIQCFQSFLTSCILLPHLSYSPKPPPWLQGSTYIILYYPPPVSEWLGVFELSYRTFPHINNCSIKHFKARPCVLPRYTGGRGTKSTAAGIISHKTTERGRPGHGTRGPAFRTPNHGARMGKEAKGCRRLQQSFPLGCHLWEPNC